MRDMYEQAADDIVRAVAVAMFGDGGSVPNVYVEIVRGWLRSAGVIEIVMSLKRQPDPLTS